MTNNEKELPFCGCGCGLRVTKPGNRFLRGHNRRGAKDSLKAVISKSKPKSPSYRAALSKSALTKKNPLPNGQLNPIPTNKDCATYLGGIAEQVLIRIFKNVQVMPPNNSGFDFICNRNYKIDVKSSATRYKGGWSFRIAKNIITDFFLCIAFESREDFTPVHLWLIPGKNINHYISISISKLNLHKWSKYEQPLDKVVLCCNKMRGE